MPVHSLQQDPLIVKGRRPGAAPSSIEGGQLHEATDSAGADQHPDDNGDDAT